MSHGINNVHVDIGIDKTSDKARISRAGVVGAMATTTVLYQSDPSFKATVDKLVQVGADLSDAEDQIIKLEAALDKARGARETKRNAYDKAHGVCAASVEYHSAIPEDVQGCGFAVLERSAQALAPPADIVVKVDVAKGVLRIRVVPVSGKPRCAIEISPDPAGPATFKRLDGTGMTRTLQGYAPGTYWVRAATLGAAEQSDWFGPVPVIVK